LLLCYGFLILLMAEGWLVTEQTSHWYMH